MSGISGKMSSIEKRGYGVGDFRKIRDFLVYSYTSYGFNWRLERWNFAFAFASTMNEGMDFMTDSMAIWEDDNGEIVSLANSEGELRGEAFFQFREEQHSKELVEEMFVHAEKELANPFEDGRIIRLHIPETESGISEIAARRGFVKSKHVSRQTYMTDLPIIHRENPDGFTIVTGSEISTISKALLHARAFGYIDNQKYVEKAVESYKKLERMHDFRRNLDLYVLNEDKEPVSFACIWYDAKNRYASVEPMGTHPRYRRRGLGRSLLKEGFNRAMNLGAVKLYGGDQQFYYDIGFKVEFTYGIWEKQL